VDGAVKPEVRGCAFAINSRYSCVEFTSASQPRISLLTIPKLLDIKEKSCIAHAKWDSSTTFSIK